MAARFADRIGKGIRGSPARRDGRRRDAAGDPRPRVRPAAGARHGRRAARAARRDRPDGAGSRATSARSSGSRSSRPRCRSCSPGSRCASPSSTSRRSSARPSSPASASSTRETKRLLAVGFLFSARALLRRLPDPQGDRDRPVSEALSPLTLALFNLAYVALAYPAGALSDRMSPRIDPDGRHGGARSPATSCSPRPTASPAWSLGVGLVGRAHGADPGHFRADDRRQRARGAARDQLRRLLVRQRDRRLLASLGAGWLWDREGSVGDLRRPARRSPRWRWRCSACFRTNGRQPASLRHSCRRRTRPYN